MRDDMLFVIGIGVAILIFLGIGLYHYSFTIVPLKKTLEQNCLEGKKLTDWKTIYENYTKSCYGSYRIECEGEVQDGVYDICIKINCKENDKWGSCINMEKEFINC